jgi:hypothetical protein
VIGRLERIRDGVLHLRELPQVLAGTEAPARTGDDDGAHVGIGCLLESGAERRVQGPSERVEHVRPVEGDRQDMAVAPRGDLAHDLSLTRL